MTRDLAEACTILRCVVGSTVHGLGMHDALDDRDEMGICIEPLAEAMSTHAPFEQFIYRSAAEREGRHDAPSQAGDLDLTIYGLRKWTRLALKGNPTVLLPLFAPPLQSDARGAHLRDLAPAIISRQAGKAFLGYLQAQRQRLLGERGNGGHGSPRSTLVAQFGYDTKYAMHMLRLGFQGVELLETGRLSLPMREPERTYLRGVRVGQVTEQEVLTRAGEVEQELKDLLQTSPVREFPDVEAVNTWMLDLYFHNWSATQTLADRARVNVIRASFGAGSL